MQKTLSSDLTVQQREQLRRGFDFVAQGAFFVAHECFEEVFRASEGNVRILFRALTQLAASYHQLREGRGRAARSTLNKALRNLSVVDCLSNEFQLRVMSLFDALGATEDSPRFIPVKKTDVCNWPMPAGLLVNV